MSDMIISAHNVFLNKSNSIFAPLSHVLSRKQIRGRFKDFQIKTNVQTAHESHDSIMDLSHLTITSNSCVHIEVPTRAIVSYEIY